MWLTDDTVGQDNINVANFTPIVQLEGIAEDASGNSVSFGAIVTINDVNRSKGSSDPAQPGNNPICKVRIVQIGGIALSFFPGGTLHMTVDPRVWFTEQGLPIDFSPGQLPRITDPNCNPDPAVITNPQSYALAPEEPPPSTQTCGGSGQPCCSADAGSSGAACLGALSCTEGVCGPTYCIPNSSFLTGADPGANAGADLFSEIISAAPFSVSSTVPASVTA